MVMDSPFFNDHLGLPDTEEHFAIEAFVSEFLLRRSGIIADHDNRLALRLRRFNLAQLRHNRLRLSPFLTIFLVPPV